MMVAVVLSSPLTQTPHDPITVLVHPNTHALLRSPVVVAIIAITVPLSLTVAVMLNDVVIVMVIVMNGRVVGDIVRPSAGRVVTDDGDDVALKRTGEVAKLVLGWRRTRLASTVHLARRVRVVANVGAFVVTIVRAIVETSSVRGWFIVVVRAVMYSNG